MEKSHRITVTRNVKYCLELLEEVVQLVPEEAKKVKAQQALHYLSKSADGESQPYRGLECQPPVKIYPS